MNAKKVKRSIGIIVVALLLIFVLVATALGVRYARQKDLDNNPYATGGETTVTTTTTAATTGSTTAQTTATTRRKTTTRTKKATTATTVKPTTKKPTTKPSLTPATSNTPLDNDGWSEIFPNLGVK